jgi:two-component system, LuxR family, response regulator FixJ
VAARIIRLPNPPVIAVVDDDEAMREALCEFLQVLAMSCRTFDSAEAFLAAYTPGKFDCLITDLRMPGMGGLQLQQELRTLGSSIPVIVVTSAMDPLSRSRAMEEGAFACLTKPVSQDALLRHLTAALAGRSTPGESGNGDKPQAR